MEGLKDRSTVFKDLRYGHDREGGGSSNQPYIKQPLNVKLPPAFNFLGNDFILRGGPIGAPLATANDLARLTKYFTDVKTPSGLLFIAKQNLLSRTAVNTEASGKLVNEGVYTPLSTLAQAGVSAFGLHLNKQGLNPIPGAPGSLRTYQSTVVANNTAENNDIQAGYTREVINPNYLAVNTLEEGTSNELFINETVPATVKYSNRLLNYWYYKQMTQNATPNITSYRGGPGSILGVGTTFIKFATDGYGQPLRTGVNNFQLKNGTSNFFKTEEQGYYDYDVFRRIAPTYQASRIFNGGLSVAYAIAAFDDETKQQGEVNNTLTKEYNDNGDQVDLLKFNPSVYLPDDNGNPTFEPNTEKTSQNSTYTYTQQDLIQEVPYNDGVTKRNTKQLIDFRAKLRNKPTPNQREADNILGNAPDYTTNRIEDRVYLGDPGNPFLKNLESYTFGANAYGAASVDSFDQINRLLIYKSTGPDIGKPINDLVKFRIAAIDNDDPTQKVYMHFRAFLGSISDSYTGTWNSSKYVGRGENFYTYDGFDRKISLSFTVAAQSKAELIPMYYKLNYLASNLSPDYSEFGYMRGPLVTLTIGGYIYEQPGFITDLSYEMSEESPWEIGINDFGDSDSLVKELPHIIKVNSFNFTPIHNFAPRKQVNTFNTAGDLSKYGPQRYIALQDITNNYDNPDGNPEQ
jgi:hypothetical protein